MGTEKPKMVWYKFFITDYQRDAAHLSLIEHGAYRLLLDHTYLSGGTLPANSEWIYRLLGAINPAEQEAIKSVLTEFFHKGRDGYTHARVPITNRCLHFRRFGLQVRRTFLSSLNGVNGGSR